MIIKNDMNNEYKFNKRILFILYNIKINMNKNLK